MLTGFDLVRLHTQSHLGGTPFRRCWKDNLVIIISVLVRQKCNFLENRECEFNTILCIMYNYI